jgi:uncharacterized membrane protein SirB2
MPSDPLPGYQTPNYPMIALALRWKHVIPPIVAGLLLLACVWVMLRTGIPEMLLGGVVLAAVGYIVVRIALEVIEVIADTLLPR